MARCLARLSIASMSLAAVLLMTAACHSESPASQQSPPDSTVAQQTLNPVKAVPDSPPQAPPGRRVVKPPEFAGKFYPDAPADLRQTLADLDSRKAAPVAVKGDIFGVVAPHAGYVYSGPIAASAFAAVKDRSFDLVVVMALKHQSYDRFGQPLFSGIGTFKADAFLTPLGEIPVDTAEQDALVDASHGLVSYDPAMFSGEHSLEVELPLLQYYLEPGFKLLPLVFGFQSPDNARNLANLLFERYGRRRDVLLVASTDWSHYFDYDTARRMDRKAVSLVQEGDVDGLYRGMEDRSLELCGIGPVATLMHMQRLYGNQAYHPTLRDMRNSGDTAADKSRVVGYAALAFSIKKHTRDRVAATHAKPQENTMNTTEDMALNDQEKQYLLRYARAVVTAAVKGEPAPQPQETPKKFLSPGAAFVTLKKRGDLRGCIGHVIAHVPLLECIQSVGSAAALSDPRFDRVRPAELADIEIEVSVLTPPKPLKNIEDIQVGRDGLVMQRGHYQGLLLPQVPVEWGWDRKTFLEQTCRKAGLPSDCYLDPQTRISAFMAIVFNEAQFGMSPAKP